MIQCDMTMITVKPNDHFLHTTLNMGSEIIWF